MRRASTGAILPPTRRANTGGYRLKLTPATILNRAEPPRDVVHFQPAVLDAYEKLLASCCCDEARLNEALKSKMASMPPLLRAQRASGEQLVATRWELLRQYRRALETNLRPPGGGMAARPNRAA